MFQEIWVFAVSLQNFYLFLIQEYHFKDYFVRFQHFGLGYHILIVSSTCVNIRAESEEISAESGLFKRWKSNVSEPRKSALNSADSELFLFETALFSSETALNFSVLNSADSEKIRTDQLWNSWSALMFIMFSESALKNVKLWNSAVQRWLPLGLQPGLALQNCFFIF